jgi:DNA-directed RNA polymerase specialized sigma24 family protein
MSTYTRELVEQLLPAAWDPEFAYGMANPAAPDPDMPHAAADKAHSNTLYAHLADIHTGWATAPLTAVERRALLMRYGLDWPQTAIARHEHVGQSTTSERITRGVGRIVATLNGHAANDEAASQ